MKGQLVSYAAEGGKRYQSFDLPGAGKFESGSDGVTSWERSVMLGPRLLPRSQAGGGLLGPAPDQVLKWTTAFLNVETVSKDQVNGAPCYLVQLAPAKEGELAATFCFDVQSGYLTRLTATLKSESGKTALDEMLSDYRQAGPVTIPHHLETKAGGQPVSVDVTDVVVNGPLPDGIFELPKDVRALKEKHDADAAAQGSPDRPTLKRSRKGGK